MGEGIARRLDVRSSLAALLAALATAAQAQAPPPPPPDTASDPWSGKVGLGYSAVTGNAKSSNVAFEIAARLDVEPWHHEMTGLALRATSTDQTTDVRSTTAERYALAYKLKYDFNEYDYAFGNLGFERDLFSGYRRQFSQVAGYGRRLLNTERQVWNFEAGAGAKQSDLSDGTRQREKLGRLATDYTLKIGDTGQLGQKVSVEFGQDNRYIESVTGVTATLVKNIGLSVSYTIKNNSDVPEGRKETDTYMAVTLQYTF